MTDFINIQEVKIPSTKSKLYHGKINISSEDAQHISLLEMTPHTLNLYGKSVKTPRDIVFYSDVSIGYRFSGNIIKSKKLTDPLKKILENVNEYIAKFTGKTPDFNGILINKYPSGSSYIGPHSDDERSLSEVGVITVSLGETRKFRIRDKFIGNVVKDIEVCHGDVYWMTGDFQKEFTHEIPKEANKKQRISLTFRRHLE